MDFGYFTLSDNHYAHNSRTANQLIADITDEALYAEQLSHSLPGPGPVQTPSELKWCSPIQTECMP